MQRVSRVLITAVIVLAFQDVVLMALLHFTGPNAFLTSVLHVKFIAYQVALPLLAMGYGAFQILSVHKEKAEALIGVRQHSSHGPQLRAPTRVT